MQAGASLFAIVVNISALIEAPPASLITAQGPHAFNPDLFWERFPAYVSLAIVLAAILHWKSPLRKWILGGAAIWVLSGVVVFLVLSPLQEEFLAAEHADTVDKGLKELGVSWRNSSLLFMLLSALSGMTYLAGLLIQYDRRP